MNKKYIFPILYAIFILAAVLRLYNLNWDSGYHMHPDERAIVLTVVKLAPPTSLPQFLSPDSPWNPKFFAYGSLPFYLLYTAGQLAGNFNPLLSQYDGIQLVGRFLSVLFDLGTLVFIFLIGKRLFSSPLALVAVFAYAVGTLPIQLSHFYAVDTPLTFFITGTLYLLLRYLKMPSLKLAGLSGAFFAAALATKFSAFVLLVPIGLTVLFTLLPVKHDKEPDAAFSHRMKQQLVAISIFGLTALGLYFVFQPYTFFDFPTFLSQTLEQSQLTKDAFAFPYTLQYVGKIAYAYELKNIILYGLGPILAFFAIAGILLWSVTSVKYLKSRTHRPDIVLLSYFWIYFLLVGSFAVGFMRYMLPVYPLLCLAAAYFLAAAKPLLIPLYRRSPVFFIFCSLFIVLGSLLWPLSFMAIYTRPNTRVVASDFIHTMIPSGSTLAIEHWDDALPLTGQDRYRMLTMTMYDPDTPQKWQTVRQQLQKTDYLILASNRLYTPLTKLTDCSTLPRGRCYPETAAYYRSLFNGSLGFTLVADITNYPTIPFTRIQFPDQRADESFTVYDHPRILIFKHMKK